MTKPLQIFMEYKIIPQKIKEYEAAMEMVLTTLPNYDVSEIEWFVAEDQPYLYVEMFEVPTVSHYQALKKLRQSTEHPVFSSIVPFIEWREENPLLGLSTKRCIRGCSNTKSCLDDL
ncbi:hypothetical protein [Alkalihalobacillus hemicellulosilyticus]|uniref:ABM domain-containing protein n=1 Tax=Halalkalibacter hemicellulosilyticusJCM 9152 TaxID=1236971 RepID=W4QGC1_9BACI|nr:hypothetical protein [Halalkalibacter hemicellulosilyticus]GAE31136.1 hypothetical protein JCM9152_2582 [Halalkalibacter hemicellulosilyticusJCM 9152]